MVRREERHWRNSASLFLDTRRTAHPSTASFELAVSAAASIGVHMAGEGFEAQLVTDAGPVPRQGPFHDTVLDALAVIKASRSDTMHEGLSALRAGGGGQVIAVLGHLTSEEARELAATRHGTAPAMAIVLGADAGGGDSPGGLSLPGGLLPGGGSIWNRDHVTAVQILIAAGWRAALVTSDTTLAAAWQQLHRLPVAASAVPANTVPAETVPAASSEMEADQ